MLTVSLGHVGQPVALHDVVTWLDVMMVGSLAVAVWWYQRARVSARQPTKWSFGAAALALAVAFSSPIDRWAASLVSGHMVQHMLILLVAAPLLAVSRPWPSFAPFLPLGARRRFWKALRRLRLGPGAAGRPWGAGAAWISYVLVLWLWHSAVLYQAALAHPVVHLLEHASFLVAGVAFWRVALGATPRPLAPGARIVYVFTGAMQGVLLSALLTFASTPWYPYYGSTSPAGLSPLADQQLAGLLMWVPAGLVHAGVALWILVGWMAAAERGANGSRSFMGGGSASARAGAHPDRR